MLQYHIYSEFIHTSKNFEGRLPRHILEKTTVFRKKGVEIWAFDGMAFDKRLWKGTLDRQKLCPISELSSFAYVYIVQAIYSCVYRPCGRYAGGVFSFHSFMIGFHVSVNSGSGGGGGEGRDAILTAPQRNRQTRELTTKEI